MAYDYDTDILAGLWTGAEDAVAPYAALIAANPTLFDQDSETRILSTIEALRSHMSVLTGRAEARLLHFCISTMLESVGSGGFVYGATSDNENAVIEGNVQNPLFNALDEIQIWSVDGVSGGALLATVAAGGIGVADVVTALNGTAAINDVGITGERTIDGRLRIIQRAVAEVTTITAAADVADDKDGTFFDYTTPDTLYRFWFDTGAGAGAPAAAGRTLVQVVIVTADVIGDVAIALQAVMDAQSDITAVLSTNDVIATNDVAGAVPNSVVGAGGTAFTFVTDLDGTNVNGFAVVVDSVTATEVLPQNAGMDLQGTVVQAGLGGTERGTLVLPKVAAVANAARDRAVQVLLGQVRTAVL
jgi:hypothetical protein